MTTKDPKQYDIGESLQCRRRSMMSHKRSDNRSMRKLVWVISSCIFYSHMHVSAFSPIARHFTFNSKQTDFNTILKMSSIDHDNDDETLARKIQSWVESTLPPPPEDQISFAGDIGSIFLYTSLDHIVNGMYDEWLNSPDVLVSKSASAAIEASFSATSDLANSITQEPFTGNSFPVWFDLKNSAPFGNIPLSSSLPISHHIQYSPALDTAGMAAVLLASSWMVCGYFTGAFNFKNTLECSPNRAIIAVTKNWFFTVLLMFVIAYASDTFVGCVDCLHKSVGLTKADEDFILDSLSVLLVWRFTLNNALGYGPSYDDKNDDNEN